MLGLKDSSGALCEQGLEKIVKRNELELAENVYYSFEQNSSTSFVS